MPTTKLPSPRVAQGAQRAFIVGSNPTINVLCAYDDGVFLENGVENDLTDAWAMCTEEEGRKLMIRTESDGHKDMRNQKKGGLVGRR